MAFYTLSNSDYSTYAGNDLSLDPNSGVLSSTSNNNFTTGSLQITVTLF